MSSLHWAALESNAREAFAAVSRALAGADCYLALYRRKFEVRDMGHVVRSLVHFDDAERDPPLRLLVDIDWEELKRDFRSGVESLLADCRTAMRD